MKRPIVLICVGLLLLSGCNLYKKYESNVTAQDNLMGDIVNAQDTVSIGDLSWRDIFKDPSLQRLIETALVNNTDMRTTQLTIDQAKNEVMSAKWGYAPTLSFTPNVTYNYQGGSSYNVQLPVQASWQLGVFGQTRSKIRSAKAKLAYDEDYRQAVQVDLAANVATYYYNLVMLDRQLEISEATEKLYEESYNATEALYQAGIYNSPAVYEMQASLEALRANIVDLRYSIATTEASLCLLLAEPPHHIERSSFEQFEMPEQLHVGLPVRLLDARPDVRMAERNMEIAYYSTQQARQSFYPSLSIDGLFGMAGSFNALGLIAQAVGTLAQPVFQGGQLTAQLRNAKANQEKARLQFVQTLYNAGSEVYQYKKAIETAEEKTGHIDIQVNALQEAYSATTELMNNGSTTYLEVLTAQESLLSAQLTQVQNQYEMIQALINLYTALGGFGK
ncbi:MAG: TolC family protein [Bacteroidales bacterium]|nr:TolC family protein [Bacteroidales bacterium]MBQ6101935.1 TolC family protein [Bacteroidales bacterium]